MTIKTMTIKNRLSLAAAATLVAIPMAVQADATGSLTVTAQVAPVCEIVTTADVAFGTLDPTADNDLNGSITWRCTNGTTTEILLDGGSVGGDGSSRQMVGLASNILPYQLYTEAGRSTPWLNTAGSGVSVTGTGYSTNSALTVYGRVTQADAAAAINDDYTDIVTVTILF